MRRQLRARAPNDETPVNAQAQLLAALHGELDDDALICVANREPR